MKYPSILYVYPSILCEYPSILCIILFAWCINLHYLFKCVSVSPSLCVFVSGLHLCPHRCHYSLSVLLQLSLINNSVATQPASLYLSSTSTSQVFSQSFTPRKVFSYKTRLNVSLEIALKNTVQHKKSTTKCYFCEKTRIFFDTVKNILSFSRVCLLDCCCCFLSLSLSPFLSLSLPLVSFSSSSSLFFLSFLYFDFFSLILLIFYVF